MVFTLVNFIKITAELWPIMIFYVNAFCSISLEKLGFARHCVVHAAHVSQCHKKQCLFSLNVMRQTACLFINPIAVDTCNFVVLYN